jgi:hypothetical protein
VKKNKLSPLDIERLASVLEKYGLAIDPTAKTALQAVKLAIREVEDEDFNPKTSLNLDTHPCLDFPRTKTGYAQWIRDSFADWIKNGYSINQQFLALEYLCDSIRVITQCQSNHWNEISLLCLDISIDMSEIRHGRTAENPVLKTNTRAVILGALSL